MSRQLPPDLKRVLSADARSRSRWDALTDIGRRDFVTWITSAKQPETRARRVESVPSRLASGKRRPCCFAVVPMDLYRALGELPDAKRRWQALGAGEKRDIAEWVAASGGREEKAKRIEKACVALARGDRPRIR